MCRWPRKSRTSGRSTPGCRRSQRDFAMRKVTETEPDLPGLPRPLQARGGGSVKHHHPPSSLDTRTCRALAGCRPSARSRSCRCRPAPRPEAPLPDPSDWTFELIEQYHEKIRAVAAALRARHLSEPARGHHRRADDGRLRLGRHAGELPPLELRQGVHRQRAAATAAARWAWRTRSSSTPTPASAT